MSTIEHRGFVDKSAWGPGPWQDEPDKVQWKDEATGLLCLIVRGPVGALCGYVGVAPGHPWFGKDYDDVDAEVHWGLTFAGGCQTVTEASWEQWRKNAYARRDEAQRYPFGSAARLLRERAVELEDFDAYKAYAAGAMICHVPDPGEPDHVWWLGFDCAHSGDLCPQMEASFRKIGRERTGHDTYKDMAFVTAQCEALAQQARVALQIKAEGPSP